MKRLRRIIFKAFTVLSVLLCATTMVMWIWSLDRPYWAQQRDEFPGRVWLWQGGIYFGRMGPAQSGISLFGRAPTISANPASERVFVNPAYKYDPSLPMDMNRVE